MNKNIPTTHKRRKTRSPAKRARFKDSFENPHIKNPVKRASADSRSWSALMATLSATILAIASICTAFIAFSTWRHALETSRPYFSIQGLPELETPNDQTLSIRFVNAGDHPAEAMKSQIIMILAESGQTVYQQGNHILSSIPKETDAALLLDLSEWTEGGMTPFDHEFYLTLWFSYYDPLLRKKFEQNFYLHCHGLIEDRFVELTYMTQEELDDLLDTVRHNLTAQPLNPLVE